MKHKGRLHVRDYAAIKESINTGKSDRKDLRIKKLRMLGVIRKGRKA